MEGESSVRGYDCWNESRNRRTKCFECIVVCRMFMRLRKLTILPPNQGLCLYGFSSNFAHKTWHISWEATVLIQVVNSSVKLLLLEDRKLKYDYHASEFCPRAWLRLNTIHTVNSYNEDYSIEKPCFRKKFPVDVYAILLKVLIDKLLRLLHNLPRL